MTSFSVTVERCRKSNLSEVGHYAGEINCPAAKVKGVVRTERLGTIFKDEASNAHVICGKTLCAHHGDVKDYVIATTSNL